MKKKYLCSSVAYFRTVSKIVYDLRLQLYNTIGKSTETF